METLPITDVLIFLRKDGGIMNRFHLDGRATAHEIAFRCPYPCFVGPWIEHQQSSILSFLFPSFLAERVGFHHNPITERYDRRFGV